MYGVEGGSHRKDGSLVFVGGDHEERKQGTSRPLAYHSSINSSRRRHRGCELVFEMDGVTQNAPTFQLPNSAELCRHPFELGDNTPIYMGESCTRLLRRHRARASKNSLQCKALCKDDYIETQASQVVGRWSTSSCTPIRAPYSLASICRMLRMLAFPFDVFHDFESTRRTTAAVRR